MDKLFPIETRGTGIFSLHLVDFYMVNVGKYIPHVFYWFGIWAKSLENWVLEAPLAYFWGNVHLGGGYIHAVIDTKGLTANIWNSRVGIRDAIEIEGFQSGSDKSLLNEVDIIS